MLTALDLVSIFLCAQNEFVNKPLYKLLSVNLFLPLKIIKCPLREVFGTNNALTAYLFVPFQLIKYPLRKFFLLMLIC